MGDSWMCIGAPRSGVEIRLRAASFHFAGLRRAPIGLIKHGSARGRKAYHLFFRSVGGKFYCDQTFEPSILPDRQPRAAGSPRLHGFYICAWRPFDLDEELDKQWLTLAEIPNTPVLGSFEPLTAAGSNIC